MLKGGLGLLIVDKQFTGHSMSAGVLVLPIFVGVTHGSGIFPDYEHYEQRWQDCSLMCELQVWNMEYRYMNFGVNFASEIWPGNGVRTA